MGMAPERKAHWLPESMGQTLEALSVGSFLDRQATKYADHYAVRYKANSLLQIPEINWTYKEYKEKANQLAKGLIASGFKKGDHIAVWAVNIPEWLVLEMASAKVGLVLVTMNPAFRANEAKYVLEKSDTRALFTLSHFRGRSYLQDIEDIRSQLPCLQQVFTFDQLSKDNEHSFDSILNKSEAVSDEELREVQSNVGPDDIFQIQFTSGTTGFPKGAMLSHFNAINNASMTFQRWKIHSSDTVCSPLPFFHTAGSILMALGTIAVGATFAPLPYFDPADTMETIEKFGVTHFGGVPTMLHAILHQHIQTNSNHRFKLVMSGGAPVPPSLLEKWEHRTGAKAVVLMGMTETSPVFSVTSPDDPQEKRYITSGRPLPHTELRIVDPSTNQIVDCGVPGEIQVRGYMVMKGYYNMKEQTAEVLDDEGWLKTGDLGILDEDGYLNVIGRIKEMIIRGGENLYPREIENVLMTHPDIEDAQLVGIPDDYWGEVAVAFIKKKAGANLTEDDVLTFCKNHLSHQKVPAYVKFVESYPLTASGKVQKMILREQIIHELKK